MSDTRCDFESRRNLLVRKHRALARGHRMIVQQDGLIVRKPRRIEFQLPVRGFVLLMAFFMLFKGFLLGSIGALTYAERLDALRSGTKFEQAAAVVMGIDPVSKVIGDVIAELR